MCECEGVKAIKSPKTPQRPQMMRTRALCIYTLNSYYRATRMHSAYYVVAICPSVCPSLCHIGRQ